MQIFIVKIVCARWTLQKMLAIRKYELLLFNQVMLVSMYVCMYV